MRGDAVPMLALTLTRAIQRLVAIDGVRTNEANSDNMCGGSA
jgi:hypothetical protein